MQGHVSPDPKIGRRHPLIQHHQATHAPGPGTHVDATGAVVASLVGRVAVDAPPDDDADGRPVVSVRRAGAAAVALAPGDVVTCRVR